MNTKNCSCFFFEISKSGETHSRPINNIHYYLYFTARFCIEKPKQMMTCEDLKIEREREMLLCFLNRDKSIERVWRSRKVLFVSHFFLHHCNKKSAKNVSIFLRALYSICRKSGMKPGIHNKVTVYSWAIHLMCVHAFINFRFCAALRALWNVPWNECA